MDKLELIKKFLDNTCTEDEAAMVEAYLASEPGLTDAFLPQEEWDQQSSAPAQADTSLKQEIWMGVEAATRKRAKRRTLYTALSIAASILALIATGMYFMRDQAIAPGRTHSLITAAPTQEAHNYSERDSTFTLPDGSIITMDPLTTIRFPADFNTNRTIHLVSGKAIFAVAHDPGHPFVVYSGNISTTALGTRFLVDHTGKKVNVQLFEGKVAVKYLGRHVQVYPTLLSPGEQCFVNTNLDGITVAPVAPEQLRKEALLTGNTLAPTKASMLTFHNVPLNDAFDVLGELFRQRISYNIRDVEKMYFTGQFHVTDSLSDILHILSSVNGLLISQDADAVHIFRPVKESNEATPAVAPGDATGRVSVTKYTNASLPEVFRAMESTFGIGISYNLQDIEHKYFTGSISSRDDVNTLLTVICRTNQLQFTGSGGKYQITNIRQTNK